MSTMKCGSSKNSCHIWRRSRAGSCACTIEILNQEGHSGEHHGRHIWKQEDPLCDQQQYLQSEWCSREMQVASFRLFDERKDVLILVFLEDIPSTHLSPYYRMRKVLRRQTYLSWPRAGPEVHVFWEKLRRALTSTESEAEDRLLLTVTDGQ
ncbi:hypothetical protein WMY93_030040 [Mugilogobius chulae]|uniref:TIR domain-containing protein n=1 Tax=Mugilogobius chulae TaxID=88201 RepID=A0AAW0MYC8_9GOBI